MPRGSSPTAAVHAKARDRESLAFELRKGGASLSDIVEKLYRHENPDGVSGKRLTFQGVSKMLKRVMGKLEAVSKEDAEMLRRLDLERLDRMLLGLWTKAKNGHEGAVDRVLRILERRAKLLGLDAPATAAIYAATSWADLMKAAGKSNAKSDVGSNPGADDPRT